MTSERATLRYVTLGLAVLVSWFGVGQATPSSPLTPPRAIVAGIPAKLQLGLVEGQDAAYTMVISRDGAMIASYAGQLPESLGDVVLPHSGRYDVVLEAAGNRWVTSLRALPGIATILPPLLAVLAALVFRQVVIALFAGIWLGAFFVSDYNVLRSFFYVVGYFVDPIFYYPFIGIFAFSFIGIFGFAVKICRVVERGMALR